MGTTPSDAPVSRTPCLALVAVLVGALAPTAAAQPCPTAHDAESAALVVREVAALVHAVAVLHRERLGADPLAPYRPLAGDWAGTLTYTDYQDDATRVALGVRIAVVETRDSLGTSALRFAYAYTEPDGRAVEGGTDLFVPGDDPARLHFGDTAWTVVERDTTGGTLRLVFVQEGEDNDRPATVRETLTAGPDGWTLLKEVRYAGTGAFFERHVYRLRRATP